MATDPATTPTPTNPTSSTTPPSPATSPGPITRLPLEILVHTLHKLRELCPNPLERQTESVKFPRVCRSFHSAYLLSDAVHECVVDFTERARKLVEALRKPGGSHLKPYSLVLNLNSNRVDDLIADLVWLCVAELREFVWNPGSAGAHPTSFEQTRLYQAWNNCPRLTKFALLHQNRALSGGWAESLLAGWPNMVDLDLFNFEIEFPRDSSPTRSPVNWIVPNQLKTLSLLVDSNESLQLLANLIKASTPSLTHLTTQLTNITHSAVTDALEHIGRSITHLSCAHRDGFLDGDCSLALRLCTVLSAVHTATLPVGMLVLPATDVLWIGRSFSLLRLFMDDLGYLVDVDSLVRFLIRVKVDRLELSQGWWERRLELAWEHAALWSNVECVSPASEWLSRLDKLVGTVDLV